MNPSEEYKRRLEERKKKVEHYKKLDLGIGNARLITGLVFFAGLWLVGRRWPLERRFLVALAIEAAWEIVENTPLIINRYREETAALGYTGDSVLNSMSDIAMMGLGFLLARRLPVWASVVVVLILELVPLLVIRDNLTLNVWMLLAPNDALKAWQSGGSASALISHFMH